MALLRAVGLRRPTTRRHRRPCRAFTRPSCHGGRLAWRPIDEVESKALDSLAACTKLVLVVHLPRRVRRHLTSALDLPPAIAAAHGWDFSGGDEAASSRQRRRGEQSWLRVPAASQSLRPGAEGYSCTKTDFGSRYAPSPAAPCSRPRPEALKPPKGAAASTMPHALT